MTDDPSRPAFGEPNEQRQQAISKTVTKADTAATSAAALESLAEHIETVECPVNGHRPVWLRVANQLRADAETLLEKARGYQDHVRTLQAHASGDSTYGPSTVRIEAQPNPPAGPPTSVFAAEWVRTATKIDLERALARAASLPQDEQDAEWISALDHELGARDAVDNPFVTS